MKAILKLWSICAVFVSANVCAQTYNVPFTGSNAVSACSGTIYDHAGPSSPYSINANGTTVITPSTPGNYVRLSFTVFAVEACCDRLTIYDGTSTAAPIIGSFTTNPGVIYATNPSGALTLSFFSDPSITFEGFEATISCVSSLPPVDLTIQSPSATPSTIIAGGSISGSCTIANIGAFQATSSSVGYYLSTDATWDASDVYLTASSGGALASGTSGTRSATLNIPGATIPGSYFIIYFADYQGVITENDETNNFGSFAITVTPSMIDLEIINPSATPTSPPAGTSITASCTIRNSGNTSASSSQVGYYLSTDAIWDSTDVYLNFSTGTTLNAGVTSSRNSSLLIPGATAPGSYYILYYADYANLVTEINEANNVNSFAITVMASTVDLIVNSPSANPTSLPAGTNTSVSSSIQNTGNTQASSSQMGYYLSTNNVWDSLDVYLNFSTGGTLNGGSSSTRSATLLIPGATVPGAYYILYYADYANLVTEVNETNNVNSVAITVQASTVDLVVNSPSANPTTLPAGTTTSVSCSIQNTGNTQASSSQVGYYLSTDNVWDSLDVYLNFTTGGTLNGAASSTRSATLTIPSSTVPGGYFILYFADYAGLVTETNETNNVNSVAITVVAPSIDLIINSPTANPTTVPAGNTVSVTCSIMNQGNTQSPSSQVGYYLSTNNVWDSLDVFLTSSTGTTLNAGSSATKSATLTIPSTTPPGTYYILYFADYLYLASETNEVNNVNSVLLTVIASTIDLIIQSPTANPTTIAQGTNISVSCTIANLGNATASSSQVGYYLSTDNVWDVNDTYLNFSSGTALNGTATATRSATLAITSAIAPGNYYLMYFADYQNNVAETNEANNVSSVAVTIVASTIDLVILNPSANPTTIPQGLTTSVSCSISNQGNTAASSSAVGYYISTDNIWDASDLYLNFSSGTTLNAGSSAAKSATLTIPSGLPPGGYYILFFADYQLAVAESNELNNVSSIAVTVAAATLDLVILNPSASPTSIMQGSTVSLSCNISNQGNTTATSSAVGYYLSSDNVWDGADTYLASINGTSLTGGTSSARNATATIPLSTTPGGYYILYYADYLNSVTENNENNNVNSVAITVFASTIDLVIQNPTANPTTIAQGRTTAVSCTIANQGNTSASSSTVGYYLSSDNLWDASDTYLNSSTGTTLNAGNTSTRSATLTVPPTTTPGTYYILYFADYLNSVTETIENNNVSSVLVTVILASVDLLIQSPSVTPTTIPQGTNASVSCTILNQGNVPSTSSNVGYYLSLDNIWDAADVYLSASTGSTLNAGATATRSATLNISTSIAPGAYYVLFFADHQLLEAETNETNNVNSIFVNVIASTTDLAIQNPTANPTTIPQGTNTSVSSSIVNQGNTQATSSHVGYYLSSNNILDSSDVYLNFTSGTTLNGGATATRSATLTIPPSTAPGTYYILFYADYLNNIIESNESNNISSVLINVVASTVDLLIQTPTATPTNAANGTSVSVSCNIVNQGNTQASSSQVGYYLSTDNVWDAMDTYLNFTAGTTLNAGSSAVRSASVTIPPSTVTGTYYIIFFADYQNSVVETNELNNYNSVLINVIASTIDLLIQNPSANPAIIPAGTSTSVSCSILNQGNSPASSSAVGYYLSTDVVWDASDVYLNFSSGTTLNAGTSSTRSATLTVSSGTTPGTYYILFFADYQNLVTETNEINNVANYPITVVAPTVDLLIQSPSSTPTTVPVGTNVSVSSIIRNQGNSAASSSTVGYYLSTDTVWDGSDIYLNFSTGTTLNAGATATRSATLTISAGTTPGTYYILFFADYQNNVAESDETNNVSRVAITVVASAIDLVIQSPSATPSSVIPGSSVSVSCLIYNQGNLSSSSSQVGYYLSTNNTWDPSDVYLGSSTGTTLGAGLTSTRSATVTIPSSTVYGSYFILYFADYQYLVTEGDETNNVNYVALNVAAPFVDLIILSPTSSPLNVNAGSAVSVSCSISNQGNSSASSSRVGYYLSANNTWDVTDIYLNFSSGTTLTAGSSASKSSTLTIPSSTFTGAYYILYYADDQNQVSESIETNNVNSVQINVTGLSIDLVIQTPSLFSSSVSVGSSVSASCVIRNNGSVTSSSSTVGYYLSTNTTIDASDVFLSSSSGGTLGAGLSSTRSATLSIPSNTAVGSYYVLFFADYQDVVVESIETNNVSVVAVTVTGLPDLLIQTASINPSVSPAGSDISTSYTILNQGTNNSSSSSVGLYLSSNALFDVSDIALSNTVGGLLSGGMSAVRNHFFTIPGNTTPGNYFVLFVVDYLGDVSEADENNNVYVQSLTVSAVPVVDIIITNFVLNPGSVNTSEKVYVSYNLINIGNTLSPAVDIGYFISSDNLWDVNDQLLSFTNGTTIAASASVSYSDSIEIPELTIPGTYFLIVYADYLNAVQEADESNNVTTQSITVTEPTSIHSPGYISQVVKIYPNPASDRLYVKVNDEKGIYKKAKLLLLNILGQEILTQPVIFSTTETLITVNTEAIDSGIYMIKVSFENEESLTYRIMIE